jgi:hypothetical protein
MNNSHNTFFSKIHFLLLNNLFCSKRVQDPFLKKKLSDYYMSRIMIPDFFYHTPLSNNYYPTIVATRVTLSLTFLFLFSYLIYRSKLSNHREKSKKYSFGLFSKRFVNLEKNLLLEEKSNGRKIILN